jgi:hypothetical protein
MLDGDGSDLTLSRKWRLVESDYDYLGREHRDL